MSIVFFRLHKPWDFSPGSLDIGNWLPYWKRSQLNRFVLNRIIAIGEQRFADFYQHHLAYYLETQEDADEQLLHRYLYELLTEDHERLKSISIYHKDNTLNLKKREIEKAAMSYLTRIDRWQTINETAEQTIARLTVQITKLEDQVKSLNDQLKEYRKLETDDYINIAAGYRDTVLYLLLQMQDLELPDGKELVLSQTQAAWTKMICKSFKEDNQPINLDTIRRYFPADKRSPGRKYAEIAEKHRLFAIKSVRK